MDNRRCFELFLFALIAGISIMVATENITTADNRTDPSITDTPTTDIPTTVNTTTDIHTTVNATTDIPITKAATSTRVPTTTSTTPTTVSTGNQAVGPKTFSEYINHYNSLVTFVGEDDHTVYDGPIKPEMEINMAWLTINSTIDFDVEIWAQTEECFQCNLVLITSVGSNAVQSILANTTHNTDIRLYIANNGSGLEFLCGYNETFTEGGDYWVFINNQTEEKCHFVLANDPNVAELPILYAFIGLVILAIAYVAGKKLYTYLQKAMARKRASMDVTGSSDQDGGVIVMSTKGDKEESSAETSKPEPEKEKKRKRVLSLDTFRGFTLVLMAFVNYGGGGYWFFEHAAWNGINVADLVFPWFVFIMGVSMNFSFRTMFNKGWSYPRMAWKIVWRAVKLFLIGFMLGTHFSSADMANVRVFGVLQRLGVTYLFSALIHMCCARKTDSHQENKWAVVRDLVLYIPEWLVNLAVLALHLSLVYAMPVPGCPTGYVGPGGLSDGGKYMNCTGGATRYIDSLILGNEHMYGEPTCQVVYQTKLPFDPEGILATLNCIFLCFLGIQYGRIILIYQDHKQRLIRFAIWIVLMAALGALLTKCSRDDGWIPANKNLWSVSYSLLTAAFGYTLLTAMYVIIDVLEIWQGQPFRYPGMNGILIYICHEMFSLTFPVSFEVGPQHWKLLLRCLWGSACWIIVAYWLFIKKIFVAL